MTNSGKNLKKETVREVSKPFITGSITDENTPKSSLLFFGTLSLVFFVAFIACATASFDNIILRLAMNLAVIAVALIIFFNNGSRHGAEAVARGEILYQKKENGKDFSESEKRICYHPAKGFITGLIGTLPFMILAVLLAVNTSIQMTEAGTLPSWMQPYVRRSDIGSALVSYTQPDGMTLTDYLRVAVRICVIPFVNIAGNTNKAGLCTVERISPIILLLPAAAYGFGYMTGKRIRTKIHTAISENEKKRIRKERKRRAARTRNENRHETEQLN